MESVRQNTFENNQLKEKIEVIRGLKIKASAKAGMLLVLLNEKPVADIDANDDEQASEIIEKCASIGLLGAILKELKEDGEFMGFSIGVSKSEDLIKELYEIKNRNEGGLNHRRYGELMGYPSTAIEAHVEGDPAKQMSFDEYDEVMGSYSRLFGFKPSKEHAAEEIEVLNRWKGLIFQYAPELVAAG